MRITVTITPDLDLTTLGPLVEQLRSSQKEVTLLVAQPLDYTYPMPYVTVEKSGQKQRTFGDDAVETLRELVVAGGQP